MHQKDIGQFILQPKNDEKIANWWLQKNIISRQQYDNAVVVKHQTGNNIIHILLEQGASQNKLLKSLEQAICEIELQKTSLPAISAINYPVQQQKNKQLTQLIERCEYLNQQWMQEISLREYTEKTVEKLQGKIQRIQKQLEHEIVERQRTEENIKTLRHQYAALQCKEQDIQKLIDLIKNEQSQKNEELNSLHTEKLQLQEQLKKMQSLQDSNRDLQQQIFEAQEKVDSLMKVAAEKKVLGNEITSLQESLQQHRQEISKLKTCSENFSDTKQQQQRKISLLYDELEQQKQEVDKWKNLEQAARNKLKLLSEDLDAKENRATLLQTNLDKNQQKIDKWKHLEQIARDEATRLAEELTTAREEVKRLTNCVQDLDSHYQHYKEKFAKLSDQLAIFDELLNAQEPMNWIYGTKVPGGDYYYTIIDKIGVGAAGIAFKALRSDNKNLVVVLKALSEFVANEDQEISEKERYMRFVNEAHTMLSLKHPNVVRGLDFYQTQKLSYCVMEWVRGISLKQFVTRNHVYQQWKNYPHLPKNVSDLSEAKKISKSDYERISKSKEFPRSFEQKFATPTDSIPLDISLTTEIIKQIAKALMYIHDQHLVHRDIKPENIIVNKYLFSMPAEFLKDLQCEQISCKIRQLFDNNGYSLSSKAVINKSIELLLDQEFENPEENKYIEWVIDNDATSFIVTHSEPGLLQVGMVSPNNMWHYVENAKSENIHAKLVDFGLVKEKQFSMTSSGDILGTPYYLAPEACSNSQVVDIRSDIYSLGIVYYQLLVGSVPFQADNHNIITLILKHQNKPLPKFPSNIPAFIQKIIRKMTEKKLKRRYQNPEELYIDLEIAIEKLSSVQVFDNRQ